MKFAIFTIHIIHKRLCCQLLTFIITLFHPVLFYITHGAPLGLALNLSCGFPFAHPRLSRYLTHTGVGISPIHPTAPHPYTQRGLTHRTFRVTLHHLTRLSFVISAHACSCPLLPHTRHLLFVPFVISAQACSYPPLPRTRHLSFVTLVISASSLPSSPSSDARHLPALTLAISQL